MDFDNQNDFNLQSGFNDLVPDCAELEAEEMFAQYAIMYEMQDNLQEATDHYQKAAIVTLDITKLDKYKESIERCRRKLELLKPSDSFIN
jgi:hypothetical protein